MFGGDMANAVSAFEDGRSWPFWLPLRVRPRGFWPS